MNSTESCRLAIWDDEAIVPFAAELAEAGRRFGVTVERMPRQECERLLRAGVVDAALVPSINVFSDTDSFEVYAPAALSAWCTPHASIRLRSGLSVRPATLSCAEHVGQETLMARIVLREHYGMQPDIVVASAGSEPDPSADSVLRVGSLRTNPEADAIEQGVSLDLGQEWFELTAYPMVWGLFVSRAGESDPRVFLALGEAAGPAEEEDEEPIENLVSDVRLRFRFDDIATASLTELAELLFFYRATADVPDLHYAPDPHAEREEEGDDEDEFRL